MIRKNLLRGIPFALALGLIAAPTAYVQAETSGIEVSKPIDGIELDPGFGIDPKVFINMKEISADNIKIINSQVYLPIETVAHQMGNILEGSYEDQYMLRKADKLIQIDVKNNVYYINGEKNSAKFEIIDEQAYAQVDFFKDALEYNVQMDGINVYIGQFNNSGNAVLSEDHLIDDAMLIMPEVYVNSEKYPEFDIKISDGQVYLPLEVITEKMGDRLEGDFTTEYYLRKNDSMLMIDFAENKYILNGVENTVVMIREGEKVYAPLSFYKDVLKYNVTENGNAFYIGEIKEEEKLPNTIQSGKWSLENGSWYYLSNGNKVTGWVRADNKWYYLKSDGVMATGWISLDGKWYLLNKDGAMETGWVIDNDNAYYLNKDGDMASNTTVDGIKLADSGVAISLYN